MQDCPSASARRFLGMLASGLAAVLAPSAPATDGKPLNIVLIYADDLGYGDLRSYNPDSRIPAPHLDRLAAEGLRLTDAHSSSGICTPSRYTLLTGRAHWRDFHSIDRGFEPPFFKPGQLTLPEMLRQNGYHTACIGKWHLGNDWDSIRKPGTPPDSREHTDFDWSKPLRGGANDHGFDYYFGDNVINFPPYVWMENGRVLTVPDTTYRGHDEKDQPKEGNWECRDGPAMADWNFYQVLPALGDKAVEYIHSRKDNTEPFFLYFSLPSPHTPIVPNDEFDGRSGAGPYGDFIVETDAVCGRLFNALREAGLYRNTIILFTADNGSEHLAFLRDEKFGHWSSAPLRGVKRDLYEGGHRVPTLLKWPGITEAGAVTHALFSQADLMATLAAYLEFPLPDDAAEDSFDFWPYLQGISSVPPRSTLVHNTFAGRYAIRHREWVLIDHPTGAHRPPPEAWMGKHGVAPCAGHPTGLYNLNEDIGQRHNLAPQHPDLVAELQERLRLIRAGNHTAPRLAK
jgi:arylsulfatase A